LIGADCFADGIFFAGADCFTGVVFFAGADAFVGTDAFAGADALAPAGFFAAAARDADAAGLLPDLLPARTFATAAGLLRVAFFTPALLAAVVVAFVARAAVVAFVVVACLAAAGFRAAAACLPALAFTADFVVAATPRPRDAARAATDTRADGRDDLAAAATRGATVAARWLPWSGVRSAAMSPSSAR
jgi:hypothetical protein